MSKPLVIGITGGIGGGKSTISALLRAEGFKVFDSDIEARQLQNEHPVIRQQLIALFGNEIYTENGLNRPILAQVVFENKELLQKLNAIVHPVIKNHFIQWIEAQSKEQLLFIESAILFESGFNTLVDKVIVMTASEAIRIARVVKRDCANSEQVKMRIANQMPDEMKISKADFVIHSDDNKPLFDKMKRIVGELLD